MAPPNNADVAGIFGLPSKSGSRIPTHVRNWGSVVDFEVNSILELLRERVSHRHEEGLFLIIECLSDRRSDYIDRILGGVRHRWHGCRRYATVGEWRLNAENGSGDVRIASQAQDELQGEVVIRTANKWEEDVMSAVYERHRGMALVAPDTVVSVGAPQRSQMLPCLTSRVVVDEDSRGARRICQKLPHEMVLGSIAEGF